jgi:DNA-binding LacI/PurR family transcriptional regulator
MPKQVKLNDVARLAGVSLGTASQALNQRSNVSEETRARVLEAALGLGYLKEVVKTLQTQAISVVGMLTKHDINLQTTVNAFYSQVQAGVEQACRDYGLSLMVSAIEVDRQNRPVMLPTMIKEQHPDGLLFVGTFLDDTIASIYKDLDIPIVLIDSYAPHLPYDSVVTDNRQGTLLAVNHLVEQGHTCIGLIGSFENSAPSILERRAAYLEAVRLHSLKPYVEDSDLLKATGYASTKRLLEHSPEVTAIFACNDEVATGVLQAARELGRSVPNNLSVIGFDNVDYAAELYPPLTTVHVHKTWMGRLGVRMLVERTKHLDQPQMTCSLATKLVLRDSVSSNHVASSRPGMSKSVTSLHASTQLTEMVKLEEVV